MDLSKLSNEELLSLKSKMSSNTVANPTKEETNSNSLSSLSNEDLLKLRQEKAGQMMKPDPDPVDSKKSSDNESKWLTAGVIGNTALGFGVGAINRMIKIGYGIDKLVKSAVLPDSLQPKYSADDLTIKLEKSGNTYNNAARSVGQFVGDIAPSMAIPVGGAATALGRIGQAAASGVTGGALYGISEAKSTDSAGDILAKGAEGGAIGGALGALGGAALEGGKAGINYALNRFTQPSAEATESILRGLRPNVESKPNPLSDVGTNDYSELRQASKNIVKSVANEDADLRSKFYDVAKAKPITSNDLKEVLENPTNNEIINNYLDKLKTSDSPSAIAFRNEKDADGTLGQFDKVKKLIQIDEGSLLRNSKEGSLEDAKVLGDVRRSLVDALDNISPEYSIARSLSEKNFIKQSAIEQTGIQKIADSPEGAYKGLFDKVMDPKTPPEIFDSVKQMYLSENPKVWDNSLKDWMNGKLSQVKSAGDETPTEFVQALMGTRAQREMLYSAFDRPGNEIAKAKLEIIGNLYDKATQGSLVSNVLDSTSSFVPVLQTLKGSKANEFNHKVVDFLTNSKLNSKVEDVILKNKDNLGAAMDEIGYLINKQKTPNILLDKVGKVGQGLGAKVSGELVNSYNNKKETK